MPHDDALERRFPRRLLLGGGAAAAALAAVEAARPARAEAAPASQAWKLGGNAVSTDGSNFLGTTNRAPLVFKTTKTNGAAPIERMRITSAGTIGIGVTEPVNAGVDVRSNQAWGIQVESTGAGGAGLQARNVTPGGRGVRAFGGPGGIGLYASPGADGTAVQGVGGRYGILGNSSTVAAVRGYDSPVAGSFTATDGGTGVSATTETGSGTGVYAAAGVAVEAAGTLFGLDASASREAAVRATATGTAKAVDASASGGSPAVAAYDNSQGRTGLGVYCFGDMQVQGTVSKLAGSFRIDHPLDPENRWLSHSFVESPDMMNVYNGNVVLGADGTAVVVLPDWFEALNRDFRYQLTCIGAHAPVYVAAEVARNRFTVAGGTAGLRVSWQVTGIRQDDYATAHPIVVETPKPAARRGTRDFVPAGSTATLSVS